MIFSISMKAILLAIGVLFFLIMLYATIISLFEREKRAARISFLLSLLLPIPYLAISLFKIPMQQEISLVILILTLLFFCIIFFPYSKQIIIGDEVPNTKIDERDIMFSRMELVQGSEKFKAYYKSKPQNKPLDDKFRSKPGLLSPGSSFYNPFTFSSTKASFKAVECFKELVYGKPAKEKIKIDVSTVTTYIKKWAAKLGAVNTGITELKDYYLYSYKGRGKLYGGKIENDHKYAIACTVEMDKKMMDYAPYGPAAMETAQQYLNSGAIAVQITEFIRLLGYEATAHIDGNYEIICPLVARDAGLGEIGRMGLLMTPNLGPRVRISVVTTTLPLNIDKRTIDKSIIHFCRICKKCADVCPSKSIPFNDRKIDNGVLRWKINSELCFTYWCTVGTDCGRCMAVCPYSHPDNLLHNFVRWGIKNSALFAKLALKLDNLFYGSKPKPKRIPKWMNYSL